MTELIGFVYREDVKRLEALGLPFSVIIDTGHPVVQVCIEVDEMITTILDVMGYFEEEA